MDRMSGLSSPPTVRGWSPRLQLQLACYDDSHGLENFIQLSIRRATRMLSCFEEQPQLTRCTPYSRHPDANHPPEPAHELMQTDMTRLSFTEQQRRTNQKLCLYCGTGGHMISSCPVRPPRLLVSAIQPVMQNMKPLSTVLLLDASDMSLPVHVLLDTGSAGYFIPGSICRQLKLPTNTSQTVYQVQSITEKPISHSKVRFSVEPQWGNPIQLRIGQLHVENIQLLVLEGATTDIILRHL